MFNLKRTSQCKKYNFKLIYNLRNEVNTSMTSGGSTANSTRLLAPTGPFRKEERGGEKVNNGGSCL